MKKIIALGLFLAAYNVYAQDFDVTTEPENAFETFDRQTTTCDENMDTIESAMQQTYPISIRDVNGNERTIDAFIITLEQAKSILKSHESEAFLAASELTADQAFDSLITAWNQANNTTMEDEGTRTHVNGIVFAINDTPYFITKSEFMLLQNDSDINN